MTTMRAARRWLAAAAWALALGASADARPPAATPAAAGARTHGLVIPPGHPRLWFDAERLAAARAWYRKNRFTPARQPLELQAADRALRGLLAADDPADQREQCRAALGWAREQTAGMAARAGAGSREWDLARWSGEAVILAFDWCHDHLSPEERAAFVRDTNTWIEARRTMPYGNVPMHQNNYYWAFLRNELEWGLASYDENVEAAERFLSDALERRLAGDFEPGARTQSAGGVVQEGSQYGPYLVSYALVPLASAGLLGRDLLGESGFWREAVYAFIYGMPPGPTEQVGWAFFPHNDSQRGLQSAVAGRDVGNFMAGAAMRWADAPVGQHAREWLARTGAPRDRFVASVDPGGKARPLSGLPLDYWAPGVRYASARTGWDRTATALFLQLGDRSALVNGHAHSDWGTWQLWRNGRFLSRETAVYVGADKHRIAGYGGAGQTDALLPIGHNSLLVNGEGSASNPAYQLGAVSVPRLESRPDYFYAAADLSSTSTRRWGNPEFVTWVREFVFLRRLETLVVLDRVESRSAGATKTSVVHCEARPELDERSATCRAGSQALVTTSLLPAGAKLRAIEEGGQVGQHRIEVEGRPGTARSYVLTVVQAKDAAAPSLAPAVAETEGAFTVTLDGATRLVFEKGMASSGGSVTTPSGTFPLRKDVQPLTVGDEGPAWR